METYTFFTLAFEFLNPAQLSERKKIKISTAACSLLLPPFYFASHSPKYLRNLLTLLIPRFTCESQCALTCIAYAADRQTVED